MKTYQCPFCNIKLNKDKLVKHIEHKHETEVATQYVNYTPYRVVYDIVNNKSGHGNCIICNQPTGWNHKTNKYFRICKNPECAKKVREQYEKRMMKVYNKTTLLDDPEHQEKMLANRRISGKYTWSDGKVFTYTGSYEKEFLEFLDKTMNYNSKDIIVPGPILEYDHNGVKRHWITDCLILSLNLIVEIKDGGSNPNKKNMSVTREKTVCKEKMITNQGEYNYLRLTNNNFAQLLGILAEMKMKMIEHDDSKTFRIHEETELLESLNNKDFSKRYTQFSDFLKDFDSPEEVMAYFNKHQVKWSKAGKNGGNDTTFRWPDRLLQTLEGNCFDQAIFFYYFCKNKGIPANMYRYAIYGDPILDNTLEHKLWTYGHLITICKCSPGWYACNYRGSASKGGMFGPFQSEEECAKAYSVYYESLVKDILKNEKTKYYSLSKAYYASLKSEDYIKIAKIYNNYNIKQDEYVTCCKLPLDNKVVKHTLINRVVAKSKNALSGVFHRLGSLFESVEEYDKAKYQEQDDIDRKCTIIYQTVDIKFSNLVEVVNGESYLEDRFTDSEVYMACYIHPKMINADYEPTFKRIITKINNHLKKTYPKENIVGFWIDEIEPLRGYGIGIEMETL